MDVKFVGLSADEGSLSFYGTSASAICMIFSFLIIKDVESLG